MANFRQRQKIPCQSLFYIIFDLFPGIHSSELRRKFPEFRIFMYMLHGLGRTSFFFHISQNLLKFHLQKIQETCVCFVCFKIFSHFFVISNFLTKKFHTSFSQHSTEIQLFQKQVVNCKSKNSHAPFLGEYLACLKDNEKV